MSLTNARPLYYEIEEVVVKSSRLTSESGEEIQYEITGSTIELNLFESLDTPFVSGQLMVADTGAFNEIVNFSGQERVAIRIRLPISDRVFEYEMAIAGIERAEKNDNDQTSILILSLIDDHAFLSEFNRLSRAYSGSIGNIIRQILEDPLGVEINDDDLEQPVQSVKVVVPNWTPLAALKWLTKRATTEFGEPFFLYSRLNGGLAFESLATLLTREPINTEENPFVYSQTPPDMSLEEEARRFIKYDPRPEPISLTQLAHTGAISANYFSVDPYRPASNFEDAKSTFNQAAHAALKTENEREIDRSYSSHVSPDFKIGRDEKPIFDMPSLLRAEINTSGMHGNTHGYAEESSLDAHVLKTRRSSDMALLEYNSITVQSPGYFFLNREDENTAVGRVLEFAVLSDRPIYRSTGNREVIDPTKSGKFLIRSCRHQFSVDGAYTTTMQLTRVATP